MPKYNIRKYGLKLSVPEIAAAIENGLGVNHQDMNGCTLLHYACEDAANKYDRLPVVEYLVSMGADPALHSHSVMGKGKGPTPLEIAERCGRLDLVAAMCRA